MGRSNKRSRLSMDAFDDRPVMPDTVGEAYDMGLAKDARPVLRDVRVDLIDPNPFQARREFADINELAEAIRQQGFTSRLRVRPHPVMEGRYELVYGERRLRAAQAASMQEVPCEIVQQSDAQMLEIGLVENIQRRDLTPMEEARAFQMMLEQRGYTQVQLAERLGKSRGFIRNRLDLLRAPEDVQALVEQRPDMLMAARAVARVREAEQRAPIISDIVSGQVSIDDVEARVRELTDPPSPTPAVEVDVATQASGQEDASSRRPLFVPSTPPQTVIERVLSYDLPRLRLSLARWQQALEKADPEECRLLATELRDDLLPRLEGLTNIAEQRGSGKS